MFGLKIETHCSYNFVLIKKACIFLDITYRASHYIVLLCYVILLIVHAYIRASKSGPDDQLFLIETLIVTLLRCGAGKLFLLKTITYDQGFPR